MVRSLKFCSNYAVKEHLLLPNFEAWFAGFSFSLTVPIWFLKVKCLCITIPEFLFFCFFHEIYFLSTNLKIHVFLYYCFWYSKKNYLFFPLSVNFIYPWPINNVFQVIFFFILMSLSDVLEGSIFFPKFEFLIFQKKPNKIIIIIIIVIVIIKK